MIGVEGAFTACGTVGNFTVRCFGIRGRLMPNISLLASELDGKNERGGEVILTITVFFLASSAR